MKAKAIQEGWQKQSTVAEELFHDWTKQEAISDAMKQLQAQAEALSDIVAKIDGRRRSKQTEQQSGEESLAELFQALPYRLRDVSNLIDVLRDRLETALLLVPKVHPINCREPELLDDADLAL